MLKDKIQNDLKESMLAKQEIRTSTLRLLISSIQYFEIQKGGAGYSATDEDVIDVVGREIKKRKESIEMFERGGRQELADKEKKEEEILKTYLPEQLTNEEIEKLVDDVISKTGASEISDMGRVMGILSPQIKGKADGSTVSSLVRKRLESQ